MQILTLVHQLTTGFILKAPWVQTRVFRPELLAEEGTSAAPLLVLAMSTTTPRTTSTRMGQEGGILHYHLVLECHTPLYWRTAKHVTLVLR